MFKWLRDKLIKGSEEEFNRGLERNNNFLDFALSFNNNSEELNNLLYTLSAENRRLWKFGYTQKTMSNLLDLDMNCRRLFANIYGGSDLKYNKKFDPKDESYKNLSTENSLESLAEDIHFKFHKTCDLLKKIKKKMSTQDLVNYLNENNIDLDIGFKNQHSISLEKQIILDIGNTMFMPIIDNEDYSYKDFTKYVFRITGLRYFQGLNLEFNYKDKKRSINLVDLDKAFARMSANKSRTSQTDMSLGKNAEEIYELILGKGKFDEQHKRI